MENLPPILNALLISAIALIIVIILWIVPIFLGIRMAKQKNYSPLWMLFGIHPIGGWITFIILACLKPRVQCKSCGGFIASHFKICPYCKQATNLAETSTLQNDRFKSDRFKSESKYF